MLLVHVGQSSSGFAVHDAEVVAASDAIRYFGDDFPPGSFASSLNGAEGCMKVILVEQRLPPGLRIYLHSFRGIGQLQRPNPRWLEGLKYEASWSVAPLRVINMGFSVFRSIQTSAQLDQRLV